jgi:hypothetical protein
MALVIKEWKVNESAHGTDHKVMIKGRQEGIFSFLFSLIGIDPTTTMTVDSHNICYQEGSWAGQRRWVIPLSNVTSGYFGYTKPWKVALALTVAFLPVFFLGLIIGPLYYFFNKQLELGFCEASGRVFPFAFKRSLIEGKNIDEKEGQRILSLIQHTIEKTSMSRAA